MVIEQIEYRPVSDIDQIATFVAKAAMLYAIDFKRELTEEEIQKIVSEVKRQVFDWQDILHARNTSTSH